LLLIFFMIAGTLTVTEPFDINPPQSDNQGEVEADTWRILLGQQGQLALQEKPVTEQVLLAQIGRQLADNPATRIQLKFRWVRQAVHPVLHYELRQSSGHQYLDSEVIAMIERAQPLPPMPANMQEEQLKLVIPVEFFLR
jgi:hypothetical protein